MAYRLSYKNNLALVEPDVNAQKKDSVKLRQPVRFFEAMLRTSADGIVITDSAQKIIFVNDTFCDFFSGSRHNLIETSISVCIDRLAYGNPEAHERWDNLVNEAQKVDIVRNVEFRMNTSAGTRHFAVNASLLDQADIEEHGTVISIWRDVTMSKQAEDTLLKAYDELELQVQERTAKLAASNTALMAEIGERKRSEEALLLARDEMENKIKERTFELLDVNTALKVLLKQREQDKEELEERVISNVKELVMPCIEQLKKSKLNSRDESYLLLLESHLNNIISPLSQRLSSTYHNLTPTEIRIANLVKDGKTTKEIADILNISTGTVSFHRDNIRTKLGLKTNKTNLRTYILSLA